MKIKNLISFIPLIAQLAIATGNENNCGLNQDVIALVNAIQKNASILCNNSNDIFCTNPPKTNLRNKIIIQKIKPSNNEATIRYTYFVPIFTKIKQATLDELYNKKFDSDPTINKTSGLFTALVYAFYFKTQNMNHQLLAQYGMQIKPIITNASHGFLRGTFTIKQLVPEPIITPVQVSNNANSWIQKMKRFIKR